MKRLNKLLSIVILCIVPCFAAAQEAELKIPAEVKPFVEKGMEAIALETSDLNGDGRADFILVLDKIRTKSDEGNYDETARPLLILTRGADGKLSVAGRNDNVVYCKYCGGVYGDPFDSIEARRNSFTVNNVGGSSDRWSASFQFNYSRRDQTWQVVRVVESSYNVFKPNKVKTKISTPPKDFGKINFADFNPGDFAGKGAK
jgi:hypothetical protein